MHDQKVIIFVSDMERYTLPNLSVFKQTTVDNRWCLDWIRLGQSKYGVPPFIKSEKITLGERTIFAYANLWRFLGRHSDSDYQIPTIEDCLLAIETLNLDGSKILDWVNQHPTAIRAKNSKHLLSISKQSALVVTDGVNDDANVFLVTLDIVKKIPTLSYKPLLEPSFIVDHEIVTVRSLIEKEWVRLKKATESLKQREEEYDKAFDKAKAVNSLGFKHEGFFHDH